MTELNVSGSLQQPRVALCLMGGSVTGAMYQIGALAALEHVLEGFEANAFSLYVGSSSGASVAAALAGGAPVERLYRALLDPADAYFPLERKHILKFDFAEWARTFGTAAGMLRRITRGLVPRGPKPSPEALWEELDRVSESLPAGFFSLDAYERFLEAFFARRGIPTTFDALPRPLRVVAHDLDSGELAVFGAEGGPRATVPRACIASTAFPPVFSPVRIGERHYIDAGPAQVAALDVAASADVDIVVGINPLVPLRPVGSCERRPTGSIRDQGAVGVMNQMVRIGMRSQLRQVQERLAGRAHLVLIEPDPDAPVFFEPNPASFAARRSILEAAYRTTRARLEAWFDAGDERLVRSPWRRRERTSTVPSPLHESDGPRSASHLEQASERGA